MTSYRDLTKEEKLKFLQGLLCTVDNDRIWLAANKWNPLDTDTKIEIMKSLTDLGNSLTECSILYGRTFANSFIGPIVEYTFDDIFKHDTPDNMLLKQELLTTIASNKDLIYNFMYSRQNCYNKNNIRELIRTVTADEMSSGYTGFIIALLKLHREYDVKNADFEDKVVTAFISLLERPSYNAGYKIMQAQEVLDYLYYFCLPGIETRLYTEMLNILKNSVEKDPALATYFNEQRYEPMCPCLLPLWASFSSSQKSAVADYQSMTYVSTGAVDQQVDSQIQLATVVEEENMSPRITPSNKL